MKMINGKYELNNKNFNTDFTEIILNQFSIDVLNPDSIKYYIIDISVANNTQSFFDLDKIELLSSIGAIAKNNTDNEFHPTLGGLLFLGNYKEIKQILPNYKFFYGECDNLDKSYFNIIQTDNYNSWSGNIYDFYNAVVKSFKKDCKIPARVEGLRKKEESPLTPILKEVLVNTILNVDYTTTKGLHIVRNVTDKTIEVLIPDAQKNEMECIKNFKNIKQANKGLFKMFYLMGVGKKIKLGLNYFEKVLRNLNCILTFNEASDGKSISSMLLKYGKYKFIKEQSNKGTDFRNISSKMNLTSHEKIVLAFIRDDVNISIKNLATNCNKSTDFISHVVASLIRKGELEESLEEDSQWNLL